MSKQIVRKTIASIYDELEGSIKNAIEVLQSYAERYPNAVIEWDSREYDDVYRLYLDDTREETDEEYTRRLAREEEIRNKSLERERAQYELLKRKYEGS